MHPGNPYFMMFVESSSKHTAILMQLDAEFKKTKFSLQIWTGATEHYVFVRKCKEGLTTAKGILQDYLTEMRDDSSEAPAQVDHEEVLERIFYRFDKVALQLTRRHSNRNTLTITDEYDVQDLLRALLALYFDDVRPEEWTPSYAGSPVRIDFLIPEIEAVIEVKKTRLSMSDKTLSEELIIDIEKY